MCFVFNGIEKYPCTGQMAIWACVRGNLHVLFKISCYIIVESLSQVRRRLNGVEKERLEAATRSNAEVWI